MTDYKKAYEDVKKNLIHLEKKRDEEAKFYASKKHYTIAQSKIDEGNAFHFVRILMEHYEEG